MSRRWMEAIRNTDGVWLKTLLAPEYALVFSHPQRAAVDRDRWLARVSEYDVHDFSLHSVIVTVFGSFATVCSEMTQSATVAGQDRSGVFVLTDSWTRRSGTWQVLQRHSVMLGSGEGAVSVLD